MCTTCGWVSHICERCAMAYGGTYTVEGRKKGKEFLFFKEGVETEDPFGKHRHSEDAV